MDPVRIDVSTPSRTYRVTIDDGALDRLGRLINDIRLPERRFVVSSPLVWRFHGVQFGRTGVTSEQPILVPDGERYKHLATVSRIYDALTCVNADRATNLDTFGRSDIAELPRVPRATNPRCGCH